MNLREVAGLATQSSNLKMADWSERAVDRVAALGAAGRVSPLGEHVFRWLYGRDPRSAVSVLDMLTAGLAVHRELSAVQREAVARYAMFEFAGGRCVTCKGTRGATLADEAKTYIVCPECGGSGLGKTTNADRASGMGVHRREYRRMEGPLEKALDWLREADRTVNAAVGRELGR